LEGNGINRVICSSSGIKTDVERTVGIKPGNTILRSVLDAGEETANQDAPIALNCQRANGTVGANARIAKAGIQRTIGIEPGNMVARLAVNRAEIPANDYFAIRLNGDGPNRPVQTAGARRHLESQIYRPVVIELRQVAPGRAIRQRKIAAHQYLAFRATVISKRLGDGISTVVEGGAWIELPIERAIQIQARKAAAVDAIVTEEISSDQHAPIRLKRQGADCVIGATRLGSETKIERAIGVEAGNAVARDIICQREAAGRNDGTVRLQSHGMNGPIEERVKIGIHPAGRQIERLIINERERGGCGRTQDSRRHWIGQLQQNSAIRGIDNGVIKQLNRKHLAEFSRAKGKRPVGREEIYARGSIDASRGVKRGNNSTNAAPLAHDGNNGEAPVLVLGVMWAAKR